MALSGGPDSTALIEVLCVLRRKYALTLAAAHLNHGLNPSQNNAHERLARDTCKRLNVPLLVRRQQIAAIAKKKRLSIEETARNERYSFFGWAAEKKCCRKIATAHTLDDQAETVLLRLLRGSGLRGIAGIPPTRALETRQVIRPFLNSSKKDILRYLAEANVRFGVDRSNQSLDFARNRVRLELLPLLKKKYNPNVLGVLASLADASFDMTAYLMEITKKEFRRVARLRAGRVELDLRRWRLLDSALQSETLFKAIEVLRGDRKGIAAAHLDELFRMAESSELNLETFLPGNLTVRKQKKTLVFIS